MRRKVWTSLGWAIAAGLRPPLSRMGAAFDKAQKQAERAGSVLSLQTT